MRWSLMIALSVIAGSAFHETAHAAPLAYDEAVQGDLSNSGPGPLLTLDIGTNTVSGKTGARAFLEGCCLQSSADFDDFQLSLPAGLTLTAIQVSFVLHNSGAGSPGVAYQIYDDYPAGGWFFAPDPLIGFGFGSSPVNVVSDKLPRSGPDILAFREEAISCDCTAGEGYDLGYTWTFTVVAAAVPEPATAALFSAALAGVALTRKRRPKPVPA